MGAGPPDPEAQRAAPGLAYMPALDGIRGVAIVVIMGYHGGVFLTRGGFYSLDTFFALSGFLITSLLIAEWQRTGTVRLRTFWARRARRLLPGILLMLLGVALFAGYLIPAGTYPTLRGDGIASLLYYANWHFIASGSNYFVQTGLTSPLTHMWSLAVEEQFYVLWPLIVLAVFSVAKSRRLLLALCVLGTAASAADMAVRYSVANVDHLYYGTDTRAQSLLVGSALAIGLSLWADRRQAAATEPAWIARSPRGRALLLVIGAAGVAGTATLWMAVSYNSAFAFRGGFLLAALATAAVLLCVVGAPRSVVARCLSWAPLRYIGRISYGMYLWHYPLFSYVDGARTGLTGYPLFGVRFAATAVIATASYYLVELPVRRGRLRSGWALRVLTPTAFAGTAAALFAATAIPVAAVAPAVVPASPPDGPPVRVLVVGDSISLTLDIGLNEHARDYGVRATNGGIFGCGVTTGSEYQLKGVDAPMAPECSGSPPDFQWPNLWEYRIHQIRPDVVMILAGRWEVTNRTYDGAWTNIENPAYAAYVKAELSDAVGVAASGGARVVLLTAPCFDSGEQPDGTPWPEDSARRVAIYNDLVRQVAATSGTSLIDLHAMACPGGRYTEFIGGQQVRESDGVHFTFTGGNFFAPKIWPAIVALAHRQANAARSRADASG